MGTRDEYTNKNNRISWWNDIKESLVIKSLYNKLPENFEAIVLSGIPEQSNSWKGTDASKASIADKNDNRYYFVRIRPLGIQDLIIPDPFLASDMDIAKKLINAHPLGYVEVINTVHPPTHGDVYLCRYTRKDKLGISLVERLRNSNKKISGISNRNLHTVFNPDKNPQLMGNYGLGPNTQLPPNKRPSKGIGDKDDLIKQFSPTTHWMFDASESTPSDWDIKNFTPQDLKSRGNNQVVMNKKSLRALDKVASEASTKGYPVVKLTNMVSPSRNGGYRNPAFNADVGGSSGSRHQYGDGFDIWTRKWTKEQRLNLLKNLHANGFRGFGHGYSNIHADTAGKRQWNYGGYPKPSYRSFDGSQ
jgi:hypothetical protein